MLGFSIQKLLVLAAVIGAVWYAFKFVGRLQQARDAEAKGSVKPGGGAKRGKTGNLPVARLGRRQGQRRRRKRWRDRGSRPLPQVRRLRRGPRRHLVRSRRLSLLKRGPPS
jgi:hypothetical protein